MAATTRSLPPRAAFGRPARRAATGGIVSLLALVCAWPAASAPVVAGEDDGIGTTGTDEALALAAAIDAEIEKVWKKRELQPSKPATDAEWLRRVRIDLTGTIPSPDEVIGFVKDKSSRKRIDKVEELLGSDEWIVHWGSMLSAKIVGRGGAQNADGQQRLAPPFMQDWLIDQLEQGKTFDQVAADIIRADGYLDENGAVAFYIRYPGVAEATSAVSRLFFGTQIQCAQCHDHPYTDWKQKDFYGMAGFFARTRNVNRRVAPPDDKNDKNGENDKKRARRPYGDGMSGGMDSMPKTDDDMRGALLERMRERMRTNRRYGVQDDPGGEIRIPKPGDTDRSIIVRGPGAMFRPDVVDPTFLDGSHPSRKAEGTRRDQLAAYLTGAGSELFGQATVNRVWAHMFGRGLCEPVDDLEAGATHPDLLLLLGKAFAKSGYDLKAIQRAIALSKTYGLSSVPNETNADDTDGYSRSYLRPMPPEALFSSLIAATGADQAAPAPAPSANRRDRRAARARRATGRNRINLRQRMQLLQRFVFTFDDDEATEALDYESSIPQALMFLNGDLVNRGVQAGTAGLLAEELAGRKDDSARVALLFLKALGRTPDEPEQKMVHKLLRAAGDDEAARREVFEDTFWALLNSSEFFFNH